LDKKITALPKIPCIFKWAFFNPLLLVVPFFLEVSLTTPVPWGLAILGPSPFGHFPSPPPPPSNAFINLQKFGGLFHAFCLFSIVKLHTEKFGHFYLTRFPWGQQKPKREEQPHPSK
jgi:hypothetical protein